ncbi:unnamed protein product [Effrenium voratum]|nr:unnamed protein product [Effrenium voratum]
MDATPISTAKPPEEGRRADLVPLSGPLIDLSRKAASDAGGHELGQWDLTGEDYSACCSRLMEELKVKEEKDLLPLLIGVLGHVADHQFAGPAGRRRGAFSKSVGNATPAPAPNATEAFRRQRRAAFGSDAQQLLKQELGEERWNDIDEKVPGFEELLSRFGFAEGKAGLEDLRPARGAAWPWLSPLFSAHTRTEIGQESGVPRGEFGG